jgi:hypothetical protein
VRRTALTVVCRGPRSSRFLVGLLVASSAACRKRQGPPSRPRTCRPQIELHIAAARWGDRCGVRRAVDRRRSARHKPSASFLLGSGPRERQTRRRAPRRLRQVCRARPSPLRASRGMSHGHPLPPGQHLFARARTHTHTHIHTHTPICRHRVHCNTCARFVDTSYMLSTFLHIALSLSTHPHGSSCTQPLRVHSLIAPTRIFPRLP